MSSRSAGQAPENHSYDVVVVGGGMVGATFACALADTGLTIAVIDSDMEPSDALSEISQSETSPSESNRPHADSSTGSASTDLSPAGTPAQFDARVSAISPASRSILEAVGVWPDVSRQRHCSYTDMHVWEADGTASVHFRASDIHAAELGYIIENPVLLRSLHQQLRELENVKLVAGRVSGLSPALVSTAPPEQGVDLVLDDGRRIAARLVVAADGANSIVRRLAGFQVNERDYEHHAIVSTVRTSLPHRNTAIQRFMDDGVLALLPLAERAPDSAHTDAQQHCSIVWSVVPDRAAQLLAMNDADFMSALQAAIEDRPGAIEWVDRRASFPLRQRHASAYVKNHIALIGDAAHSIHPLAGLGVNLGLLDAWSLAGQIRRALRQQRDFSSLRVLQRYQRERIGNNLAVMWLMEGFKRLFADQPLALRWLRNTGMRGVDSLPLLKNQIMRQAMGTTLTSQFRPPRDSVSSSSELRR